MEIQSTIQISVQPTGRNISCALAGCYKKGGKKFNKKIKKYLDEIEKTEKKIADLQQYLKSLYTALKQEENNEMIKSNRGMKLDSKELFEFLNGIQEGTVKFEVKKQSDGETTGSFVRTDQEEKEEDKHYGEYGRN